MDIIGDRKFVEIPGDKLHELPPLLVRSSPTVRRFDKVLDMAQTIVQSEDMIDPSHSSDFNEANLEQRRMDLAINVVNQYLKFLIHWQWGEGIVEWIRQCETTFQFSNVLRPVLRPDVWPHAARCSFVTLLGDKNVRPEGISLERAVGMRLTFRQPPPIDCFSNQFLFYLNTSLAETAYQNWSSLAPPPTSSLPPERFTFQIVTM